MQLFFIVIGNLIAKKNLFGSLKIVTFALKKKTHCPRTFNQLLLNYQTRASGTFESVNKMSEGKKE